MNSGDGEDQAVLSLWVAAVSWTTADQWIMVFIGDDSLLQPVCVVLVVENTIEKQKNDGDLYHEHVVPLGVMKKKKKKKNKINKLKIN